jgi:hypothetical protein
MPILTLRPRPAAAAAPPVAALILLGAGLLGALVNGCGYTTIDGVWRDPAAAATPRHRIAVIGLTKDELLKRNFEDYFVKILSERGNEAVAGYSFLTPAEECDSAATCTNLAEHGFDTILTATVTSTDKQVDYVPGSTTYVPETAYTAYHRYYYTVYREETVPGYEREREYVRVETNLYDATDLRLLWAATTTTERQQDVMSNIKDYGKVVIEELAESKLIR